MLWLGGFQKERPAAVVGRLGPLLVGPGRLAEREEEVLRHRRLAPRREPLQYSRVAHRPGSARGPDMLHRYADLETEGFDAAIIACFDDTGLDAARSLLSIPVFGLCQSAASIATSVCERVAIVTTMPQSVPPLSRLLTSYIGTERSAGVYAAGIPVLDLETPSDATLNRLLERCEQALDDGADGLILGCAGLSQLAKTITQRFGVPVIEPISAATKLAEATVGLGLRTSKAGGWTPPRDKTRT